MEELILIVAILTGVAMTASTSGGGPAPEKFDIPLPIVTTSVSSNYLEGFDRTTYYINVYDDVYFVLEPFRPRTFDTKTWVTKIGEGASVTEQVKTALSKTDRWGGFSTVAEQSFGYEAVSHMTIKPYDFFYFNREGFKNFDHDRNYDTYVSYVMKGNIETFLASPKIDPSKLVIAVLGFKPKRGAVNISGYPPGTDVEHLSAHYLISNEFGGTKIPRMSVPLHAWTGYMLVYLTQDPDLRMVTAPLDSMTKALQATFTDEQLSDYLINKINGRTLTISHTGLNMPTGGGTFMSIKSSLLAEKFEDYYREKHG